MLNNESLLNKADAALADLTGTPGGGLLQPAQAQRFLRVLIDEAVLMKMATVIPMRSPKQLIEKIQLNSRILRAGTENAALPSADRSKPALAKVELDAQLFKAEIRLNNEVVEDSIERGQLRQTIMQLMAERIALDIDEILVQGDISSTDPFLAKFDGLLNQVSTNQVEHSAATTNRTLFKHMMKAMPHAFIRNKKALRFLTSISSEIDYRDALGDRATVVGDRMVEEDAPTMYAGIPVVSVPMFPENIGTGTYCTAPVLIDPKNITVGIWRDIRVETDKLISEGVLLIVATMRFDMKLAHEPASVIANNVRVNT
jgi:HK97 family phage major capsid protein